MTKTKTVLGIMALSALSASAWAFGGGCGPDGKDSKAHWGHGCHKAMHAKACDGRKNMDAASREQRFEKKMDMRLERMAQRLQLSEEQQKAIRNIMVSQHQKMQDMRQQKRAEIDKILTPEQQEKVEQFRHSRGF
ncbi:hypothetical protein [Thiomicrorhabdus sp.]|uniref:hypothetical protein n=1 Tax=Thiomicrorhabdus sp. TaxID=2039724 RepID=UPI0029C67872|nr:hypothetical protein [Thiomicrorhabdus sp.]